MKKISYSGLSTYKQCPRKYDFIYNKSCRSNEKTLALELGEQLHEIMEDKINMQLDGNIDYDILKNKYKNIILDIEKKYDISEYEKRIKIFSNRIEQEEDFEGWTPIGTEVPFNFEFNGFNFNGFIDLILEKDGEYWVVDYKSSKKIFDNKELPTNLQFFIYCLAIEQLYGKQSIRHTFDFILLDEKQEALTKGFYNRGIKALNNLTDELKNDKIFKPKQTPLCYYCHLSGNTMAHSEWFNDMCEYYSLWRPEDKNFEVNKIWEE